MPKIEIRMMIIFFSYLVPALAFYWLMAKTAPVEQESQLAVASQSEQCQVIEIFGQQAAESAKRAA